MDQPIRVFIIDDNVMVRFALSRLLSEDADILVVGDAPTSEHLLGQIKKARPDIVILDVPVPRELGIKQLRTIRSLRLPTIVFTKQDPTITKDLIELLDLGAVGFVTKPKRDEDVVGVRDQLVHEVKINCKTKNVSAKPPLLSFFDPPKAVAIGSSTGGPDALVELLSHIKEDFPAGIAVVQHMPAGFTAKFAQRLDNISPLSVKEAEDGDILKAGTALIAPGDLHMTFIPTIEGKRRLAQVKLTKDPPQWGLRPTVDRMMVSLTEIYQRRTVGVILTGMGQDGVVGMRLIKEYGGTTLVQNKASSVVFGMAQEVIKNNLADEVRPLTLLATRIQELV